MKKPRRSNPVETTTTTRAANDQPSRPLDESLRWKDCGRRRGGARPTSLTASGLCTTANGAKNAGGAGGGGDSRARINEMSHLQRELIGRRKDGVSRNEARQMLLQQLIWRDTDATKKILDKRWCIFVASKATDGFAPQQIWCQAYENEKVVARMALLVKKSGGLGSTSTDSESPPDNDEDSHKIRRPDTQVVNWLPENISDLNAICQAINKMYANCWNSMFLVPASQYARFIDFFHWLKTSRDSHYRRDTQSIRLDRLMCIEDVIQVFREYNKHEGTEQEAAEWERLTAAAASASCDLGGFIDEACEYTRNALRSACAPSSALTQQIAHQTSNQIQAGPFGNPFLRLLPPEPEPSFGFDDDRSPEEQAETLRLVQSWLAERCPEDAEHEGMEPFNVTVDLHYQMYPGEFEYMLPYFSLP